jgi:carboxyl-terminal processing protease
MTSRFRIFVTVFFLAFVVGCAYWPRTPGPAAVAAANQLASDIATYRATHRLGLEPSSPALRTFARVFDRVRTDYVRPVDEDALMSAASKAIYKAYPDPSKVDDDALVMAAINGMLASLDRYSTYLDPQEWQLVREQTRGQFGGLGIEVRKGEGYIEVVSPLDGTPAERAGLRPGDRITHADGEPLGGLSLRAAVRRLRGEVGEPVTLTIEREGRRPFDVVIVRELIRVTGVRWRLEGDVGYVRISSFTEDIGDRVEAAVRQIRDRLGRRLRGIVLDLRNNPGGLFDESIEVSDAFLQSGRIVTTRGRNGQRSYGAERGDVSQGLPIVVLINGGSASAAEIVAGALRDQDRAVLVGLRSFGKGTVQTVIPLGGNDALKLTTAIYLTPSGKSVDGGIEPDIVVEMDDEREGDEQLERALEVINRLSPGA